eukprot:352122-Chlamydomonas_euryale.AAC.17
MWRGRQLGHLCEVSGAQARGRRRRVRFSPLALAHEKAVSACHNCYVCALLLHQPISQHLRAPTAQHTVAHRHVNRPAVGTSKAYGPASTYP